jgi:gamma-glutamylcyclotransferase (GGCT)/AIG2-like uncharacterized protein YtfP
MNYFAYGANVNKRGMARRCPAAKVIGLATLDGYKLCFRQFADLSATSGSIVSGVLWDVTPACLRSLDRYEGADYKQVSLDVVHEGQSFSAIVYMMSHAKPLAPPSMEYYQEVAAGYRDFGLDEALLRRARYDTLRVSAPVPATASAPASTAPAPGDRPRRRALWDPAQHSAGDMESLSRPRVRPKPE